MTSRRGVVIGVIAAGVIGSAWFYLHSRPRPQLLTQVLDRGDIVDAVGATGTIEALQTVDVGTQVSGTILELHADFNVRVRKGEVVAQLDPSLFRTQVEQARANLTQAVADRDRLALFETDACHKRDQARTLMARGLVPQSDLDTAEASCLQAAAQVRSADARITQSQASLNQAQVSLDKTVIASPIDGVVIARNVDVGQTVAASLQAPTLFVIAADLTRMRVNASINEADVGRVRPGQTVRFRVDAFPAKEFTGALSLVRLSPVVQQNVVTYTAQIDVSNPALELRPGMTATVTIEIAARRDVVRLPNAALRFRPSAEVLAAFPAPELTKTTATPARDRRAQVWILSDGALQRVPVETGITDGTYTELLDVESLQEGAPVVTGVLAAAGTSTTGSSNPGVANPLMGPTRGGRGGRQ